MFSTVKQSIKKLEKEINVISLLKEKHLGNEKMNLVYQDNPLIMETSNYLSAIKLGEKTRSALQLPEVGALIYASDILADQELFDEYITLVEDFTYVNDGNILNLLTLTNNMSYYHTGAKKPYSSKITLNMIKDVKVLTERLVSYNNKNKFMNNVYTFSGCYTSRINRGHKVSICNDRLFIVDLIDEENKNDLGLEIITYYVLLKRDSNFNYITNIKEIAVYDPYKDMELVVDVNSISEELVNEITLNII